MIETPRDRKSVCNLSSPKRHGGKAHEKYLEEIDTIEDLSDRTLHKLCASCRKKVSETCCVDCGASYLTASPSKFRRCSDCRGETEGLDWRQAVSRKGKVNI